MSLSPLLVEDTVKRALFEDIGHGYDLTSQFVVDGATECTAVLKAREDGVLAGIAPAITAFTLIDPEIEYQIEKVDGEIFKAGEEIAFIRGAAQSILTAERTALNFLRHLSGVASLTHQFVSNVEHTDVDIICTRKTLPHLRGLQKDAVRSGGGKNHRFGLDDGILIKDNHLALCENITSALENARNKAGHMVRIQVEVDNLDQLKKVYNTGLADAVLLDNMSIEDIKEAVRILDDILTIEVSGGVNLEKVAEIAETGVHCISVGALTHSARSVDLALDVLN